MASRVSSRLRAALLVPAILVFLAALIPTFAGASNPYEYTDRHEGDPGDGVLDPSIDGVDGGSSGTRKPDVDASAGTSLYQLDSKTILIPVYIGSGQPGQGTFIFLPQAWWRAGLNSLIAEGRSHYAP